MAVGSAHLRHSAAIDGAGWDAAAPIEWKNALADARSPASSGGGSGFRCSREIAAGHRQRPPKVPQIWPPRPGVPTMRPPSSGPGHIRRLVMSRGQLTEAVRAGTRLHLHPITARSALRCGLNRLLSGKLPGQIEADPHSKRGASGGEPLRAWEHGNSRGHPPRQPESFARILANFVREVPSTTPSAEVHEHWDGPRDSAKAQRHGTS